MSDIEKRSIATEVRAISEGDEETSHIVGHGAVFNRNSELLFGSFREQIAPGAFDNVLNDDVRALFNHDPNFVLGRTLSGTLQVSIDAEGLRYDITPPDTPTVRDLVIAPIKRGDISGSSFAFSVLDDEWREEDNGIILRTITNIGRLLDVSPVTYPAYPDAGTSMRSLEKRCAEVRELAQRAINQRRARERFLDLLSI